MRSKKLFLGKERNSVCRTEIHTTGQATNPNSKAQGSLMMDSPKNIKHFTAQKCAQLICDNTVPALAEEGNKHWHQQLLSQNSTRTKILTSKEPIRWNITDYWQTQKWQRTAGPKTILTTDHFFFLQPLLFACFSKFMNPEHTPLPGLIQVWETKFMDFSRAIKKNYKKTHPAKKSLLQQYWGRTKNSKTGTAQLGQGKGQGN